MEYFSRLAGIKLVHVPYKGSNELTAGVIAGEVQLFFNGASNITPHMQSGALRGLAISTTQRVASIPNLPTVREAGVPEYSSQGWFGILAPRGTPPAMLTKVEMDVVEILNRPDVKRGLEQRGFVVYASSATEFASFLADETAKWQRVVQEVNIKPE
jgi:tripartite-type tricarboxylate transporter receptor subunit TctC